MKSRLRKQLINLREALPPEEAARCGEAAQNHILQTPQWENAKQILLYHPLRQELDTRLLITTAWESGKELLLPRCLPDTQGEMCLAPCSCMADLKKGKFGLMEPNPVSCPAINLAGPDFMPDLAIIPAVGFDISGNRLGFGAGYYDRFLVLPSMQQALLIGFAYSFQLIKSIPADPWDHPVHAICTEEGIVWL